MIELFAGLRATEAKTAFPPLRFDLMAMNGLFRAALSRPALLQQDLHVAGFVLGGRFLEPLDPPGPPGLDARCGRGGPRHLL